VLEKIGQEVAQRGRKMQYTCCVPTRHSSREEAAAVKLKRIHPAFPGLQRDIWYRVGGDPCTGCPSLASRL